LLTNECYNQQIFGDEAWSEIFATVGTSGVAQQALSICSDGTHARSRLHGRARRKTLAEDHRWNKTLGFAGME